MIIAMVGNFGLWQKGTMGVRALPMAKALAQRGHSVCLVLPPWDDPGESGHEYAIDGVRIVNVGLPPRVPLVWHALLAISVVWRTLREPSDVVHIFKPKAYAGFVGLVLWLMRKLRLSRARLVVDADDWEGTGGWNEIESLPRVVKWFVAWHERKGLRWCDAVTTASRELEALAWSVGVPGSAVHYVPNGVFVSDAERLAIRQGPCLGVREGRSDGPSVLLFTRFFEYSLKKVVDLLGEIVKREPNTRLVIVGKGLRGEEEELAGMLQKASLADKATFVGWVDKEELPDWFGVADVAIYPMDDNLLNRSKCPMKLVDLMVNGVPVVAERVGQVAEYVEDGVSGILIEPGDVPSFAEAVVGLLADEAARARIGNNARERILQEFEWHRLVGRVESAYGDRTGGEQESVPGR